MGLWEEMSACYIFTPPRLYARLWVHAHFWLCRCYKWLWCLYGIYFDYNARSSISLNGAFKLAIPPNSTPLKIGTNSLKYNFLACHCFTLTNYISLFFWLFYTPGWCQGLTTDGLGKIYQSLIMYLVWAKCVLCSCLFFFFLLFP